MPYTQKNVLQIQIEIWIGFLRPPVCKWSIGKNKYKYEYDFLGLLYANDLLANTNGWARWCTPSLSCQLPTKYFGKDHDILYFTDFLIPPPNFYVSDYIVSLSKFPYRLALRHLELRGGGELKNTLLRFFDKTIRKKWWKLRRKK